MSDAAVIRWRDFFCGWRSPTAAQTALEILSNQAGDHMLDDPRMGWAKEAWIANRYGTRVGAEGVRLLRADPPDFEVIFSAGGTHRCEAVEVVRPGRRRGDELRQARNQPWLANTPIPIPEDEWMDHTAALQAVDEQITRKAAKGYPERYVLAIYVNLGFIKNDQAFRRGLSERDATGHPAFERLMFLYN